jgi:hypothetical protein
MMAGMTGFRGRASGIVAVTSGVLVASACSVNVGDDGETRSQAPKPRPVSVQQYGTTLTGAVDPLESALKGLAKARAYKRLDDRVTAVEAAAGRAAATMSRVTPPAELADGHAQLVDALQAFHGELGGLRDRVADQGLCSGTTVRAGLGDADGTSTLRDALAAVDAKLPGDPLVLTLPSAGQKAGSRPPNGRFIRAGNRGGRGELTIDNGGSGDAVVTLSKGRRPAISVYVRAGKKFTVKGVPDGSYSVFFTGGGTWDAKARAFGRDCAFQRFEESFKFRTTTTATQIRWSTWSITLQPVEGGTARTSEVDPDDFPE